MKIASHWMVAKLANLGDGDLLLLGFLPPLLSCVLTVCGEDDSDRFLFLFCVLPTERE